MLTLFNLGDPSGQDGTWHTDPANGIWNTSAVTEMNYMFYGCNAFRSRYEAMESFELLLVVHPQLDLICSKILNILNRGRCQ